MVTCYRWLLLKITRTALTNIYWVPVWQHPRPTTRHHWKNTSEWGGYPCFHLVQHLGAFQGNLQHPPPQLASLGSYSCSCDLLIQKPLQHYCVERKATVLYSCTCSYIHTSFLREVCNFRKGINFGLWRHLAVFFFADKPITVRLWPLGWRNCDSCMEKREGGGVYVWWTSHFQIAKCPQIRRASIIWDNTNEMLPMMHLEVLGLKLMSTE